MEKDCIINKSRTCCFTGPRSGKLPECGLESAFMQKLCDRLYAEIENAVYDNFDTFITGMAEGVDLLCARLVHEIKVKKHPDISLVAAIPFSSQYQRDLTDIQDRYLYDEVLDFCDRIIEVSPDTDNAEEITKVLYKRRNEFMVEASARLIGTYCADKTAHSGTLQTIRLALDKGLEAHIIRIDGHSVGVQKDLSSPDEKSVDDILREILESDDDEASDSSDDADKQADNESAEAAEE